MDVFSIVVILLLVPQAQEMFVQSTENEFLVFVFFFFFSLHYFHFFASFFFSIFVRMSQEELHSSEDNHDDCTGSHLERMNSHQRMFEKRSSEDKHVRVPLVWDDLNPDDICCVVEHCGQIVSEGDFAAHLKKYHSDCINGYKEYWDPLGFKVCFPLFFFDSLISFFFFFFLSQQGDGSIKPTRRTVSGLVSTAKSVEKRTVGPEKYNSKSEKHSITTLPDVGGYCCCCPRCSETFVKGAKVVVLECGCVFHSDCFKERSETKKWICPIHG